MRRAHGVAAEAATKAATKAATEAVDVVAVAADALGPHCQSIRRPPPQPRPRPPRAASLSSIV